MRHDVARRRPVTRTIWLTLPLAAALVSWCGAMSERMFVRFPYDLERSHFLRP